jgi:hypothetical protein
VIENSPNNYLSVPQKNEGDGLRLALNAKKCIK